MSMEKRGVLVEEAAPPKPKPQTKSAAAVPPPPPPSAGNDLASRLADAAAKKTAK